MKLPSKPIESALVTFSGDPSVGIRSTSFELELFFDLSCYGMEEKELIEYVEQVREKIKELYTMIDDEGCGVMFDFEIEQQEEIYRRMEQEESKPANHNPEK